MAGPLYALNTGPSFLVAFLAKVFLGTLPATVAARAVCLVLAIVVILGEVDKTNVLVVLERSE